MSDKKTSKDAERDLLAPVSFDEFKKPTYEQWQAEVEKALKGGNAQEAVTILQAAE